MHIERALILLIRFFILMEFKQFKENMVYKVYIIKSDHFSALINYEKNLVVTFDFFLMES